LNFSLECLLSPALDNCSMTKMSYIFKSCNTGEFAKKKKNPPPVGKYKNFEMDN